MKKIFLLVVVMLIVAGQGLAGAQAEEYGDVLAKAVYQDKVNYQRLCQSQGFKDYLSYLAKTDPNSIQASDEKLAFWINAYNTYNAKVVCTHYPIKNLNELHKGGLIFAALRGKTVWDKPITVGGKTYSLKQLDHQIIKQDFKTPLSQFGLACGSLSCPPLRAQLYQGENINEQLADQARRFFANTAINRFDKTTHTATISPIMKWNAKYFGATPHDVLLFIADYLPSDISNSIKLDIKRWKIKYSVYDLIVNDQP